MNDPIDDKALDDYLGGNSRVSQAYRELDDVVVPPELDRQVLARARDAIAQQQAAQTDKRADEQAGEPADELERLRRRRKRLMQWSVPAGLAASAVLVVAIVMQSGVQQEMLSLPQPATVPAASPAQDDRADDRQEGPVVLMQPDVTPSSSVHVPADAIEDAAPRQPQLEKIEATAKRAREETQTSPVGVVAGEIGVPPAPPPFVPAPAPLVANDSPATTQGSSLEPGRNTAGLSGTAIEQKAATRQAAESAASNARDAKQAAIVRQQAAESNRATSEAEYDLSEVAVTGSRVSQPASAGHGPRSTIPRAASVESRADTAASESPAAEQPEPWLQRIRQLRKDDKAQDADREWKRFLEAYPEYPVAEADLARSRPR